MTEAKNNKEVPRYFMTTYEILTVTISLFALLISICTFIWTVCYRGKLEWHFIQDSNGWPGYTCIIVNSGNKAVTPFEIAAVTTKNKYLSLSPDKGENAVKQLLQPGEILQLSFVGNLEFVASMLDAQKLVLIDSYGREFPLDKQEFTNIKKGLKSSEV